MNLRLPVPLKMGKDVETSKDVELGLQSKSDSLNTKLLPSEMTYDTQKLNCTVKDTQNLNEMGKGTLKDNQISNQVAKDTCNLNQGDSSGLGTKSTKTKAEPYSREVTVTNPEDQMEEKEKDAVLIKESNSETPPFVPKFVPISENRNSQEILLNNLDSGKKNENANYSNTAMKNMTEITEKEKKRMESSEKCVEKPREDNESGTSPKASHSFPSTTTVTADRYSIRSEMRAKKANTKKPCSSKSDTELFDYALKKNREKSDKRSYDFVRERKREANYLSDSAEGNENGSNVSLNTPSQVGKR